MCLPSTLYSAGHTDAFSKCFLSAPSEWAFCHWIYSIHLFLGLIPPPLPPLLELQLLSLACSLFTGWMCLFSEPERESKCINSPTWQPSSQQRSLFCARTEPPTAWRCGVHWAQRALYGKSEGQCDARLAHKLRLADGGKGLQ